MKNHILSILGCVIVIASCASKEEEIAVASVSVGQSTAEMIIGETLQLQATVSPSNATDKTVIWASSKQSVATVSNNGLVTAIAEGSSTITATAGGKSSTCQITVSKNVVAVTSVTLSQESLLLKKGESATLQATVNPADATEKTVKWASSDTAIATVDSNGKVTGVAGGNTIITAKVGDKQASCTVTVTVPIESISLDRDSITLEEGATATLIATVKPDDVTDKTVSWNSSNSEIAMIDENGNVTAIKEGEATITAKAGEKTATCKVIVQKKVIAVVSIQLNKTELTLEKGQSETLVATVMPDDATDKTVAWSTSNEQVASVENTGKVTSIAGGSAIITAKAGEKEATCVVTVTVPVSSISLDQNNLTLEEGQSVTLIATILPEDATDKTINWFSSDESLAKVENGLVTAVKEGAVTITAKAGEKSADCEVAVIAFDPNNIRFADPKVKEKLVAAFDSDGDGQLSYEEAAAVSSCEDIKKAFGAIKTYKSFDEFQYFTGIDYIADEMFREWAMLNSIILPKNIKRIGKYAFYTCPKIVSIDIPSGVTSLGEAAFAYCSALTSITIPESVSMIENSVFVDCGKLNNLHINNLSAWLSIGFQDFESHPFGGSISGHIYLDGVELTEIVIPDNVSIVKDYVFFGCTGITSVTVPHGISSIGKMAFNHCSSLTTAVITDGVSTIGEWGFGNCASLSFIALPQSVSFIGDLAFAECSSLTSVSIPEGVSCINQGTFQGCTSLTSVSIPESVSTIGVSAFIGCTSLTSIAIPESVSTLEEYVFASCKSLTSIIIPESISTIGYGAFEHCTALTSIVIPESVISIKREAFCYCASLKSIIVKAAEPPSGGYAMFHYTNDCPIYVPTKSVEAYRVAEYWSDYAGRINAIE